MEESLEILVVDDDTRSREELCGMLHSVETCIIGACSAEETVEFFTRHRPRIVFIDVDVAGISGAGLTQMLKAIDPHVLVAVVSERSEKKSVGEAVQAGANDFLLRPVSDYSLKSLIERFKCILSG